MIYTDSPKYVQAVIKRGKGFRVFLDDTAQIIGSKIEIVSEKDIEKGLKKNAAVLVDAGYAATYGRSRREAMLAMEVLEKACYIYLAGEILGGVRKIPLLDAKIMRLVYKKKYSKKEEGKDKAETGRSSEGIPERELELRQQLVEYGNRLVEKGLVSGTWGNLSVRLDDTYMLVTPSGIVYDRLGAGDMVKVNIETLEYEGDLKPTSEKVLHARIYKARHDVNAVIHTHQTNGSVYAACEKGMEGIDLAKYELPGTEKLARSVVRGIGENRGCIMSHHGVCVVGRNLDYALDACVDIEDKAGEQF